MSSGWNLGVWLECIGVVSGCCFNDVYRYPHNINYLNSTCISSIFAVASLLLFSFLKCFSFFSITSKCLYFHSYTMTIMKDNSGLPKN